jgi:hypothetical protein
MGTPHAISHIAGYCLFVRRFHICVPGNFNFLCATVIHRLHEISNGDLRKFVTVAVESATSCYGISSRHRAAGGMRPYHCQHALTYASSIAKFI